MNKLRLDYFLSLGLELVEGDTYTTPLREGHIMTVEDECDAENANNSWARNNECYVTSFAPRENTGEQPCGDDIPIILTEGGCSPGYKRATSQMAEWNNPVWYPHWTPDHSSLIEMQYEHDKQAKTVVEEFIEQPVSVTLPSGIKAKSCAPQDLADKTDWDYLNPQDKAAVNKLSFHEVFKDEFKKGLSEMVKPRMKVEYVRTDFHSVWEGVKAMEVGGEEFFFKGDDGWLKVGNLPAIMQHLCMEELYRKVETEINLKQEQINYYCELYSECVECESELRDLLDCMSANGDLASIK